VDENLLIKIIMNIQIVIIDLEDVEPSKECASTEQSDLFKVLGQYVIPVAYRVNEAPLGTEESAESVVLLNHKWISEMLYLAGETKIKVQLVPGELADRIAAIL
jgi:hypothetical protein